jgi:hypothetical protein
MTYDNLEILPFRIKQSDDLSFTLTNPNGVLLYGMGLTRNLSDLYYNRTSKDTLFFPYIKAKDGNLHLIRPNTWAQDDSLVELRLDDTKFDIGKLFGPAELVSQETIKISKENSRSSLSIEITDRPNHLDKLRVFHPSAAVFDPQTGTRYDDLIFVASYFINGKPYTLDYGTFGSRIYVNADLDPNEISKNISEILIRLKDSSIFGIPMSSTIFINTRKIGNAYGELKAQVFQSQDIIKINNEFTNDIIYADGGFLDKPHPILESGNSVKFKLDLENLLVKTNSGWSQIDRICKLSDSIKPNLSESEQNSAILDFNTKETVQLTDNEVIVMDYNSMEVRERFKPRVGVLSLFEIKDFDFSTYSSDYSKNLILDLYKDYFVPANTKILDFSKNVYRIIGEGIIKVNGIEYTNSQAVNGIRTLWQDSDIISEYSVINGNAIVVIQNILPKSNTQRLDVFYFDESLDAQDYTGPFSLKADHAVVKPDFFSYEYREKFLYGNVESEYQVYLENYTKEFATDNRVVPYISKWGLIDSTDSRDNPYRLNSDIMFGKDNFGPSHRETIPTAEKLTHEWFYIESDFNYSLDPNLLRNNFYYFNTPIEDSRLISEPDYFESYFNYIPTYNGVEVGRAQARFSTLKKNETIGQYETFFKGSLFRFYELDLNLNQKLITNRFDDYKFSAILKPVKEEVSVTRRPVNYRVIENLEAKAITLLIELAIAPKEELYKSVYLETADSPQNNIINQSNLFENSLESEQIKYKIDRTITVTNSFDYFAILSGQIQIPNAQLGETIHLVFDQNVPPIVRKISCIISTQGSQVYEDIQLGKISNGDKLAQRVHVQITKPFVTFSSGTYPAAVITPSFQDGWLTESSVTPLVGNLNYTSPSAPILYVNESSSGSIPQFKNGPINQNLKLSRLAFGDTLSVVQGTNENLLKIGAASYVNGVFTLSTTKISGGTLSSTPNVPTMIKFDYLIPAINDTNLIAETEFQIIHDQPYIDSIFGDYRIEFNAAGVSNLTHSFLYSAKSKKYNSKQGAFSSIKLTRGIDLSPNGLNLTTNTVQSVRLPGLEDYDSFAYSEIEQVSQEFAPIYIIKPGEKYILVQTSSSSFSTQDLQNPNLTNDGVLGASTDTLVLSPNSSSGILNIVSPQVSNFGDQVTYTYSGQLIPFGTLNTWIESAKHLQIFGGVRYFAKIFELVSFAKFVQILELNPSLISWETYSNGQTDGVKRISMEVVPAEEIVKSTVVSISEDLVQAGQVNGVAGYVLSESSSQEYDLNRYSGNYDVIFKPLAAFKYYFSINSNQLIGANVCLNPNVDNFFTLKDFEYVKFSNSTILDLENSQNYSSVYPLVAETPIDRTNFNILSSSWDNAYHFEYSTKSRYSKVPGTRRITEDYSFVSKLLNLPSSFIIESYTSTPLENAEFSRSQATQADIVYSNFKNEVRFKINLPNLITKTLSDKGLRSEFNKFFKYQDGTQITNDRYFFGDLTVEEFLSQYSLTNLVPLYQINEFEFYSKDDRTIANNSVIFNQVSYNQLNTLSYRLLKTVRINNTKSSILEGSILIKPDTGISLVPKIKINLI